MQRYHGLRLWYVLDDHLKLWTTHHFFIGFFLGRTPLISLSPKKTWEGFLGAFVSTVVFGYFFSGFLLQSPFMICPADSLSYTFFNPPKCTPNSVFVPQQYLLTPPISALIKRIIGKNIVYAWAAPVQLHVVVMAVFSSLIAPFGGFFASGIKRAFKIKDFGDSIPGHGGLTDR
jgi:phosphatidate cytidylyltransferase